MTIQAKLIDTSKQFNIANAQLQIKVQDKKRSELTLKELEGFGNDANTFKSVGRMYVPPHSAALKISAYVLGEYYHLDLLGIWWIMNSIFDASSRIFFFFFPAANSLSQLLILSLFSR